jgi:hypothetical protein
VWLGALYKIKKLLLQISGGVHVFENYKKLSKVKVLPLRMKK